MYWTGKATDRHTLNVEREIVTLFSNYETFESRTLQLSIRYTTSYSPPPQFSHTVGPGAWQKRSVVTLLLATIAAHIANHSTRRDRI
jgi:hypothetical protein